MDPTLSVVIPSWREAALIADAVACARAIGDEVVVSDGRSDDGTPDLARRAGARVVTGPRGRGRQLHAGAQATRGTVLLFLHADARLPPAARGAMLRALADPAVPGGNFRLRYQPPGAAATLFGHVVDGLRRHLRVYYGDSGIFLRRDAYRRLGGFRPYPVFEDLDLARRLERLGPTAYLRDVTITASSRRFAAAPARTVAIWTALHALYGAGVAPARLARFYADIRAPSTPAVAGDDPRAP